MYIMEKYLESLKIARENARLTQKEVESSLGLRKLMMRDYEMGRLKLPVSVAIKLSRLYGVSLDSLLGQVPLEKKIRSGLDDFKSLFYMNEFEPMFYDPVIRGALKVTDEDFKGDSIFHQLTADFSKNQSEEFLFELMKILTSLSGVDGKIRSAERECIQYLLSSFALESKSKACSKFLTEPYLPKKLPKVFNRIEIKHFTIWMMFFFAGADEEIVTQEIEYTEKIAELLKLNRTNFIEIKSLFIKEKF